MLSELTGRLKRVTNGRPWVPEIDGLRFLAIAGVILFHMWGEVGARSGMYLPLEHRYDMLNVALGNGDRGVRLFFVISGLVLALPFARHYLTGGKPVLLRNYFMRRLTRLEPPYLLSVLLFIVLFMLYQHPLPPRFGLHALATMFYLHSVTFFAMSPINFVSWSLEVEVQFYLIAPFIMQLFRIRDKRIRRITMLALIALFIPVQIAAGHTLYYFLSLFHFIAYFLSGLLAADVFVLDLPQWREHVSWDAVALACMVFAIAVTHDSLLGDVLLPLVFATLCLAAMRGPIIRRFVSTPWVAVIGGMCYSIYLMHMTAIAITFKLSRSLISTRLDFLGIFLVQACIFIPAILLAGTGFYLLIERPCMDPQWPLKLKHWFLNRGKTAALTTRG